VTLANVTSVTVITATVTATTMIEFLLIFMIDNQIVNKTQRFKSIDRCLYFAERLTKQPSIPTKDGDKRITAYCKPINK
jgi:hypothetical protein